MRLLVSSCVYEILRLLSLLVLACIKSLCLYVCMSVSIASKDERLGVLVFGCVARCNGW